MTYTCMGLHKTEHALVYSDGYGGFPQQSHAVLMSLLLDIPATSSRDTHSNCTREETTPYFF